MDRSIISVKTVNDETLKGYLWNAENPIGNFIITTGMEEHALRYDEFAKFLVSKGFNVVCIDHYGQGLNSTDGKLSVVPPSFFSKTVRVLDDLVKKAKRNGLPTTLFGHSMGSFMVQDYVQRFANHADYIVICGTNGPNNKLMNKIGYKIAKWTCSERSKYKKSKLVASMALGAYTKAIKNRRTDFDWLSYDESNVDRYIADPLCGYGSSKIFYREFLKGNARLYEDKFINKISKKSNILIVGGINDPVGAYGKGPKALYDMYKGVGVENVQLKIYENMRHEILNEKDREIVYNDIVDFIKK